MTNSDTGLPELPEGHFWRVERVDFSFYTYTAHAPYVTVQILSRRTVTSTERSRFLKVKRQVQKVKEYTNHSEAVREEQPVTLVINIDTRELGNVRPTIAAEKVTAADIRRTAELALAEWQSALAAEALLGDYPPKKLEVAP